RCVAELDGRVSEHEAFATAVAGQAFAGRGDVVRGAERVAGACGRRHGVRAVGEPDVGLRRPIFVAGTDFAQRARFDPHAVDAELFPQLGADRKLPVVRVALVDAGAGGKAEP